MLRSFTSYPTGCVFGLLALVLTLGGAVPVRAEQEVIVFHAGSLAHLLLPCRIRALGQSRAGIRIMSFFQFGVQGFLLTFNDQLLEFFISDRRQIPQSR